MSNSILSHKALLRPLCGVGKSINFFEKKSALLDNGNIRGKNPNVRKGK